MNNIEILTAQPDQPDDQQRIRQATKLYIKTFREWGEDHRRSERQKEIRELFTEAARKELLFYTKGEENDQLTGFILGKTTPSTNLVGAIADELEEASQYHCSDEEIGTMRQSLSKSREEESFTNQMAGLVSELVVVPELRGRGVATKLVEHVVTGLINRGCVEIACWTRQMPDEENPGDNPVARIAIGLGGKIIGNVGTENSYIILHAPTSKILANVQ